MSGGQCGHADTRRGRERPMPVTQALLPGEPPRRMSSSSHHLAALHGFSETVSSGRHGETVERQVTHSWQASFHRRWGLQS